MREKNSVRNRIDYLKAFASILVVVHHHLAYYESLTKISGGIQLASILCHSVNVSLFIVIAGYLCHKQSVNQYYVKKLKRILLPFITFSVLKLVYSLFISNEFAHGTNLLEYIYNYTIIGNQYWFAYAMIMIFLAAPLLWKFPKHNYRFWILIVLIMAIMLSIYDLLEFNFLSDYFQLKNAIHYFWFFIFGYMLKHVDVNKVLCIDLVKNKMPIMCFTTLIAVTIYSVLYYKCGYNYQGFPVRPILGLLLGGSLYSITFLIPCDLKLFILISKYSLQIMFFDGLYRIVIFKVLRMVGAFDLTTIMLGCILNIAMTIVSCLFLEKTRYVKILFGL